MRPTLKVLAACTLIAGVTAALPLVASANPFWRCGQGMGPYGNSGYTALAPEKQTALYSIMREHREKTQPIRDQLWAKETTLRALSANPNTTPDQINGLVTEMTTLRRQLQDEDQAYSDRLSKEVGVNAPFAGDCGWGYGRHGGYMGRHMGHHMGRGWR